MTPTDIAGLAGIPIIAALVQIAKGWVTDRRWWPVLAIVFGLALNMVIAVPTSADMVRAGIVGLVAGLGAAGLYDVGKRTIRNE